MIHSEALRAIRESQMVTPKELALEAGISLSYLCDLEAGRKHGSEKVIRMLADALKVSPRALVANPNDSAAVA